MRNKFDHLLISRYGPDWFKNPAFVGLFVKKHFYVRDLLAGAQSKAAKGHPPGTVPPRGKVIAELTFGFWTGLTASRFEHTLWTPLLRQTFRGTPPSRANFSTMVDQLRILRNRLAHHEPIFHRNLSQDYHDLCTVAGQLCPLTAMVMGSTSSVKRELMAIPGRRKRRR